MAMASTAAGTDRLTQLKAFDDTKAGVKGLVDAGVTTVPPIFHHPLDPHDDASNNAAAAASLTTTIPVIDLAAFSAANNNTNDAAGANHHQQLVAQVKAAAETVGFFQVVNHGVPAELLARMLASVRSFNEEPAEARRRYYTRDPARRVRYQSNFDLFYSPAASWRDTVFIESAAETETEEMPAAFRDVVPEYTQQVRALGAHLLALLSEALGLPRADYLQRDAGCLDGPALGCHYYPPCPEPRLTLGTARHSDPSFLTVLLQDDAVGGLQALVGGGWVDVPPLPGALVVNVGDFLQLMSNDRFKSVEHRVVAVPGSAARVSAACFFRPTGAAASSRAYGPLPDLVKPPEAPRYRSVTAAEFLGYYRQKGLDGRSALDHFRLLL
ncbi:1-aminocyclopropane-1-carboxylate oxidase homolog 3 [Sorghum bicolor]|nr:1-aminocyclopropane-1-carboxylate oxidase homolog 3 [Sorghum bicolor]|eukprot:XP_002445183.1 1-aminocyclopropane-1-carboxylate oxidase homolog 3 [Sorghum bicolor]